MVAQATGKDDLSWLFEAERDTVYVCPDESGAYIRGGQSIYFLPLPGVTCECPSFLFRGACRHQEAVRKHLREQAPCPHCDGYLTTTLEYREGSGYILQAKCGECSYRIVL